MPQHTENNTNQDSTSQTEYYVIQKNIPITHAINRPKWADKVREMEVGDSILLPTYHICRAFIKAADMQNVKVISRKLNKGYRIWRVEG